MSDDLTTRLFEQLQEVLREAQGAGDHDSARAKLRDLAQSLLDGSAQHSNGPLHFAPPIHCRRLCQFRLRLGQGPTPKWLGRMSSHGRR